MFITTPMEITNLMPTTRWKEPEKLLGYLEEEERVALEPLLGTPLYEHLCREYERLTAKYVDITSATIKPTRKAKADPAVPYADVTELQDAIRAGRKPYQAPCVPTDDEAEEVPEADMQTIELLRICQRIEFYKMLSHKAGLIAVSLNEGGGMNLVSADGYEPASSKDREEARKDAFMSAGRAVDSLLLFLEADAKGDKLFTSLWQEADGFYLHKDLLFQTARVLNEYLDINGERWAYVKLVRDIRFCQNTYLKPAIGGKLLQAVVDYLNNGKETQQTQQTHPQPLPGMEGSGQQQGAGLSTPLAHREGQGESLEGQGESLEGQGESLSELAYLLRQALAFFVESRRQTLGPKDEKMARRDSMADAKQGLAEACAFIEHNLDALGDAAVDSPIYNAVRAREAQEEYDRHHQEEAQERRRRQACMQQHKKLFTAFPHTTRAVDISDR